MRYDMAMPDLATTGSEIRVIRWAVQVGAAVKRGQTLLEIETDKATMDVECVVDGVLTSVAAAVGDMVAAGTVIATLEVKQTSSAGHANGSRANGLDGRDPPAQPAAATPVVSVATTAPTPGMSRPRGMFARNRAAAAATHPSTAHPSTSAPIDALGAANKAAVMPEMPPGVPMTIAQRTAGRRLQQSKQTVPHFYLQTSFSAKAIAARRKAAAPAKLAWDAFFVCAVGRAMRQFPRMGFRVEGDRLVPPPIDAVGVAVDSDGDLYVISVSSPADKTPEQSSEEIRSVAAKLRAGDKMAARLPQVAMTITNLGLCNVESFIPIINPPEAAILGIGKVMPTPVARDTRIAIELRATLTLSVDHRVVSGKYAGDFLGAIVHELETFSENLQSIQDPQ